MPRIDREAARILGIEVRSGDKMIGRLIDILVRADGSIYAAVIEYGGFLGIGSRKVAVPWPGLRFERHGRDLVAIIDLTVDELRSAPEY
ncbi:MAG: PRC-barrel domain-containing protein [Hyphomicrobiaceae bacterium]